MYAFRDEAGWHFQSVGDDYGSHSSLVLDGSGNPHISYCANEPFCFGLKYAYLDDTGWHIQYLDSNGLGNSLALDSSGYPHISYSGGLYQDELRYVYQDTDDWHYHTVDNEGYKRDTSLALDDNGYPRISFIEAGNLMYAYQDEGGWHIQSVDTADDSYLGSLALDAEDYPHISYSRGYVPSLRYAYQDESGWHSQSVDSDEVYGGSLALDADGKPHISYFGRTSRDIKYAYQDVSGWSIETVESLGVGSWGSALIDVDGYGLPHISYKANYTWKYAYKALPVTPTAVTLSGPTAGIVDNQYTFTAAISPISASVPIQYQWQATEQSLLTHTGELIDSAAFTWGLPGTKSITITASNPVGTVSDTHLITITDIPVTSLLAWNDSPSIRGSTTILSASVDQGSNVLYEWDFGDQSSGYGISVTHVYSEAGIYTATVKAYNTLSTHTATTTVTSTYGMFMPLIHKAPLSVKVAWSTAYSDGAGNQYIGGSIVNESEVTVYSVQITARLYNEYGHLIGVYMGNPALAATFPGMSNPFDIFIGEVAPYSYDLDLDWSIESPVGSEYQPVTVVSQDVIDQCPFVIIQGQIRNDQADTLQGIQVIVLPGDRGIYNYAEVSSDSLAPGETTLYSDQQYYPAGICPTVFSVLGQGYLMP
jgi:hypothetical protein